MDESDNDRSSGAANPTLPTTPASGSASTEEPQPPPAEPLQEQQPEPALAAQHAFSPGPEVTPASASASGHHAGFEHVPIHGQPMAQLPVSYPPGYPPYYSSYPSPAAPDGAMIMQPPHWHAMPPQPYYNAPPMALPVAQTTSTPPPQAHLVAAGSPASPKPVALPAQAEQAEAALEGGYCMCSGMVMMAKVSLSDKPLTRLVTYISYNRLIQTLAAFIGGILVMVRVDVGSPSVTVNGVVIEIGRTGELPGPVWPLLVGIFWLFYGFTTLIIMHKWSIRPLISPVPLVVEAVAGILLLTSAIDGTVFYRTVFGIFMSIPCLDKNCQGVNFYTTLIGMVLLWGAFTDHLWLMFRMFITKQELQKLNHVDYLARPLPPSARTEPSSESVVPA